VTKFRSSMALIRKEELHVHLNSKFAKHLFNIVSIKIIVFLVFFGVFTVLCVLYIIAQTKFRSSTVFVKKVCGIMFCVDILKYDVHGTMLCIIIFKILYDVYF